MQSSSELFTYAATTPLRGMALLPSHYWAATKDHLLQILGQFPSIGLAQMEAVALMDATLGAARRRGTLRIRGSGRERREIDPEELGGD